MNYYNNKNKKHSIKLTKNKTKNKNGTTYTKYVITIPKELIHDCELEDEEFVIVEKINDIPGFLCRKKIPEIDNFWGSAMTAQRRDLNESSDEPLDRLF